MQHVHTVLEFLALGLGMIIILLGWMYRTARDNATKAYDYTKDMRPVKATREYTKQQLNDAEQRARTYLDKRASERAAKATPATN
jgi:hypothetical protein